MLSNKDIKLDFDEIFPFDQPRPLQREIIEKIAEAFENGKKHAILSAPTGIGKSVIALALSKYLGSSYILTSQKVLQDQYANDFFIPKIKGRYNYICSRNSRLKCDFGMCIKKKYSCKDCPYQLAKAEAFSAPISVFNYTYFFNSMRAQNHPQIRDLLVCDEAHNCEQLLIDFASVSLAKTDFLKFKLGKGFLSFPTVRMSDDDKLDWLFGDALGAFQTSFDRETLDFKNMDINDYGFREQSRKCKYLDTIVCMINRFKEELDKGIDIIIDQKENKAIAYKLLFGRSMADSSLFQYAKKSLSMSATLFSKEDYCKNLDLDPDESIFVKCPSMFPKENRPIYFFSVGNLSYATKEKAKPKIIDTVSKILKKHKDQRGIIHTVNYELADCIYSAADSHRLIFPKGKERDEHIEYFMESTADNLVLISPSLQEGIDLTDDLSRFYILVKTPYPGLGDPWVKARMKADPMWYTLATIKSIVQASGRSVRSKDDFAIGYILDSSFAYFFNKNEDLFPDWWKEALHFKTNSLKK